MIRFSAFLVIVAIGLLVAGVVTSTLLPVYLAIGVSGVALLALGAGAIIKRSELFGEPKGAGPEAVGPEAVGPKAAQNKAAGLGAVESQFEGPESMSVRILPSQPGPQASPQSTAVPAGSGLPAAAQSGPSVAGYLSAEQPLRTQPPAAFTPGTGAGPQSAASGNWERRDDAPAAQPPRQTPHPASVSSGAVSAAAEPGAPSAAAAPAPAAAPAAAAPPTGAAEGQLPAGGQGPPRHLNAAEDQEVGERERSAAPRPGEDLATVAGDRRGAVPAAPDNGPAAPEPVEPARYATDLQREVAVVPGVPRYHNARCILIRFMGEADLDKMTLAAAREAGCTPCRACVPDQAETSRE